MCGAVTTLKHDDLTYFDGNGTKNLTVGTYEELGMRDASFTVSVQVFMPLGNDAKTLPPGHKHIWSPQAFLSPETEMRKDQDGFMFLFESRELHARTPGPRQDNDCGYKTGMSLTGNQWNHFVAVYDKTTTTMTLFVNTLLMATCTSVPPNLGNQRVVIGKDWGSGKNFLGWMRDVRVMKGALDVDGVKRLYASRGYVQNPVPAVVGLNTDFRVRDLRFASTHPNLTADGLSLTIPDKQAAPSSEGCFWDSSPAPDTPVPAPTSKLADLSVGLCATLQVADDGQPCGGMTFNRVGFSHWTSTDSRGIVRTLWPSSPLGEYVLCTTVDGGPNSHFFLNMSQPELQSRALCTLISEIQTDAPPTASPPTPAPLTPHPATPAPATPAPPTPAPPTGLPGVPPTPAPLTGAPRTPWPGIAATDAPLTASPSTVASPSPSSSSASSSPSPSSGPQGNTATPTGGANPKPASLLSTEDEGASKGGFIAILLVCIVLLLVCVAAWIMAWKRKTDMARAAKYRQKWGAESVVSVPRIEKQMDTDSPHSRQGIRGQLHDSKVQLLPTFCVGRSCADHCPPPPISTSQRRPHSG